jgi:hypothetical protein
MKKKIVSVMLALVMTASVVAGCAFKGATGGAENEIEENNTVETGDEEANKEEEKEENIAEPEEVKVTEGRHILKASSYDTSKVFIVDDNGTKVDEFDMDELCKKDEFLRDASYCNLIEYADGIAYSAVSFYDQSSSTYKYYIVATDVNAGKSIVMREQAADEYIQSIDEYSGHIYMTFYDYVSSGKISYREYLYTKAEGELAYTVEDAPCMDVLNMLNDYSFALNRDASIEYTRCDCFTETFDKYGYAIATKGHKIYKIGADKTVKQLVDCGDHYVNVIGYDDAFVTYTSYEDDENKLYCYSMEGGVTSEILVAEGGVYLLYSDGGLYYYKDLSETYGVVNHHIFKYEPAFGTNSLVYEIASVPGIDSYNIGIQGFSVIDGQVYFVNPMEKAYKWVRVNFDENGASYTDIYCTLKELDSFNYGTVSYVSNVYNCPYCGTPLYKEYIEYFQFDPEKFENAGKINEVLFERYKVNPDNDYFVLKTVEESECEYHKETPEFYTETNDVTFSNVKFIGDKYVEVTMNGYWYGGGAHGYPEMYYQLFDLTTGEEKTIKDFYEGTEEDFKNLLVEQVKKDYEAGKEYIYGMYTDDIEQICKDVYDYTGLDTVLIDFMEDGISVEYSPYTLGPYASGFICVEVSYQDLLGRDSL